MLRRTVNGTNRARRFLREGGVPTAPYGAAFSDWHATRSPDGAAMRHRYVAALPDGCSCEGPMITMIFTSDRAIQTPSTLSSA